MHTYMCSITTEMYMYTECIIINSSACYILVKASQREILHKGVVEGRIKHEAKPSALLVSRPRPRAKPSALLVSRPRPRAIFPIVHERKRCFNWFSVIYGAIQIQENGEQRVG